MRLSACFAYHAHYRQTRRHSSTIRDDVSPWHPPRPQITELLTPLKLQIEQSLIDLDGCSCAFSGCDDNLVMACQWSQDVEPPQGRLIIVVRHILEPIAVSFQF